MIKAIPTVYQDVQMRSRLEARTAEFFDRCKIKWLYEIEGYDLDGLWYLPDFWLPELETRCEVKGVMSDVDSLKIERLVSASGKPCVVVGPYQNTHELRVPQEALEERVNSLTLYFKHDHGNVGVNDFNNYFGRCFVCAKHILNPWFPRSPHYLNGCMAKWKTLSTPRRRSLLKRRAEWRGAKPIREDICMFVDADIQPLHREHYAEKQRAHVERLRTDPCYSRIYKEERAAWLRRHA